MLMQRLSGAATLILFLLFGLLAGSRSVAAQPVPVPPAVPPAAAPVPPPEELEKSGALIGEIVIRVKDIFDLEDPRENRRLYRLANKLHRTTREQVIANQLLFKTGDRFSQHALDESARLLRQNRYFNDAQVRAVRYQDGRVDVEVVTHDVWTLNAGVGVGRSGGANTTRFLLQDTNFLGTGKAVTLERETNVDRTTSLFQYDDRALWGTHGTLSLSYSNNSDGHERSLSLAEPFYSLDTRWAAGTAASTADRVDSLYELGHITDRFRHRQEFFELHGGLSSGLVNGWARRWTAGFAYQQDRFGLAAGFAAPSLLPEDRTLAYPWVAFDLVQDQYLKARNLDQIQRTEDLHLGSQLHLSLGYASTAYGADRDAAVFDSSLSTGFKPSRDQTFLFSSGLSGRWVTAGSPSGNQSGNRGAENVVLSTNARYYWRDFGEHLFFVTFEAAAARNLDVDNQLLLGGDTGLRGYPLRYQDGDRRALITLEQRFFTDYYPFRLVRVGGAVFFDAGRTWPGESGRAPNFGLLKDVGVGLRLSASRSGLGNVVHLDLAFPLDGDRSIKRVQWLVRTKSSF
jgi:outer membrane protein assembly factor BamA